MQETISEVNFIDQFYQGEIGLPSFAVRSFENYYTYNFLKLLYDKGFTWNNSSININGIHEFFVEAETKSISVYDNSSQDNEFVVTFDLGFHKDQNLAKSLVKGMRDGEFFIKSDYDRKNIRPVFDEDKITQEIVDKYNTYVSIGMRSDAFGNACLLSKPRVRELGGVWNEKSITFPSVISPLDFKKDDEEEEKEFNKFEKIALAILGILEENYETFTSSEENRIQLGFIMWRLSRFSMTLRLLGGDHYFLKDTFDESRWDDLQAIPSLYYHMQIEGSNMTHPWDENDVLPMEGNEDYLSLMFQKNKTPQEWRDFFSNKNYPHKSIYTTKKRSDDRLFCIGGHWNKNGYLVSSGSFWDNPVYTQSLYAQLTIEPALKVKEIFESELFVSVFNLGRQIADIHETRLGKSKEYLAAVENARGLVDFSLSETKEKENDVQIFLGEEIEHVRDRFPSAYYPINESSAIVNFPDNIEPEAKKDVKRIAKEIYLNPREDASSARKALKTIKRLNGRVKKPIFHKTFLEVFDKKDCEYMISKEEFLKTIADIFASYGLDVFISEASLDHYTVYDSTGEMDICFHVELAERCSFVRFDWKTFGEGLTISAGKRAENPDFVTGRLLGKENYGKYLNRCSDGRNDDSNIGSNVTKWGNYTSYNDETLMGKCKRLEELEFASNSHKDKTVSEFIGSFLRGYAKEYRKINKR